MSQGWSVAHAGPWAELEKVEFRPPGFPRGLFGKAFLKEALGLVTQPAETRQP